MPVTWQARSFASRKAFIEWLAPEVGVSSSVASTQLYRFNWNIEETIAYFRARTTASESPPESIEPLETATEHPPSPKPAEPPSPDPPRLEWPALVSKHNTAIPVLYRGAWYASKTALARFLAKERGVNRHEAMAWLFPPIDEDLQPRLDYFVQRKARLAEVERPAGRSLLIYAGRLYLARLPLVRWLAEQIDGTYEEITAVLRGLAGDVTREVELYCDAFNLFIPPADPGAPELPTSASSQGLPAPLPAPPVGLKPEPGNGHAGNGTGAVAQPASPGEPAAGETGLGTGAMMVDGLATTIAEHIAAIVAVFTARQTPAATTTTTIEIAPLVRHLQDQENQLAKLTARLARLEHAENDNRQVLGTVSDTLAVVLRKTGQVSHDLDLMTRGRSPVRHTRARPLGIEPIEPKDKPQ